MLPENLGHLFDVPLQLQPTAPAIFQDDVVLTFQELDERCNRMANALASLGVRPGDRVALMFINDYKFIESLLGTMRLGAVPVPLNIRMGDEALNYVTADSEAVVLIANSEMAARARSLVPQLPSVRHFIVDAERDDRCAARFHGDARGVLPAVAVGFWQPAKYALCARLAD